MSGAYSEFFSGRGHQILSLFQAQFFPGRVILSNWSNKNDFRGVPGHAPGQFFAHNEVKIKKKGHNDPRCPILCPKWSENIGGRCCQIIGGYRPTSLHEFAPMVMIRFKVIEKLYLSKALLKMAGRGGASPSSPPGSAPGPWYATKRLFASFATAIFQKICRGPLWPKA